MPPTSDAGGGHDLVVVAASAGGVEALSRLVGDLPAGLPAAVLVALHVPATWPSHLDAVLARRSRLPVLPAVEGEPLVVGRVVVARPDTHLLVVDGRVVLGHGVKEHGSRPSHDAMLRSAALDRGPRVVGVVLTGLLDDGAAGLACVARYGGACLVQDPVDADHPSMPEAAVRAVPTATVLPLPALVQELIRLVGTAPPDAPAVDHDLRRRDEVRGGAARGEPLPAQVSTVGPP